MWAKVKAFCLHSATMAVTYVLGAVGLFFEFVDAVSNVSGSPDFANWMSQALKGDTVLLGRVMIGISILVAIARLRTILWYHKPDEDH